MTFFDLLTGIGSCGIHIPDDEVESMYGDPGYISLPPGHELTEEVLNS